jgi:hypothetical protein
MSLLQTFAWRNSVRLAHTLLVSVPRHPSPSGHRNSDEPGDQQVRISAEGWLRPLGSVYRPVYCGGPHVPYGDHRRHFWERL